MFCLVTIVPIYCPNERNCLNTLDPFATRYMIRPVSAVSSCSYATKHAEKNTEVQPTVRV